jgi:hypothetical protein
VATTTIGKACRYTTCQGRPDLPAPAEDKPQDDQAGQDSVNNPDEQAQHASLDPHEFERQADSERGQGVAETLDPFPGVEDEAVALSQVPRVALGNHEVIVEDPVMEAADPGASVEVGHGEEQGERPEENGCAQGLPGMTPASREGDTCCRGHAGSRVISRHFSRSALSPMSRAGW